LLGSGHTGLLLPDIFQTPYCRYCTHDPNGTSRSTSSAWHVSRQAPPLDHLLCFQLPCASVMECSPPHDALHYMPSSCPPSTRMKGLHSAPTAAVLIRCAEHAHTDELSGGSAEFGWNQCRSLRIESRKGKSTAFALLLFTYRATHGESRDPAPLPLDIGTT
jgi:hypothetical protein